MYDYEMVDATIADWVGREINADPSCYPDTTDWAAMEALYDARGFAEIDSDDALRAGVQLGVALTVAVLNDPLGDPLPAVREALAKARLALTRDTKRRLAPA